MCKSQLYELQYYPLDIDFMSDIKIKKLICRQGGKAIAVYVSLLCLIYQRGYYIKWTDDLLFVIAKDTAYETAYIREVINCCLSVGLLNRPMLDNNNVLTSEGIQRRYIRLVKDITHRDVQLPIFSLVDGAPEQTDYIGQNHGNSKLLRSFPQFSANKEKKEKENEKKKERTKEIKKEKENKKKEKSNNNNNKNANARIEKIEEYLKQVKNSDPDDADNESLNQLDRHLSRLTSDRIWLEAIAMQHHIAASSFAERIQMFRRECIAQAREKHLDYPDTKRHFANWLRIQLRAEKKEQQYEQRSNPSGSQPYQSAGARRTQSAADAKRDANAYAIEQFEARTAQRIAEVGKQKPLPI